jgi:amphi-Trp domain-containing protein
MQKSSLTHNFVSDPSEVAGFFQALIDGFDKRKIAVSADGRELTLVPAELVEVIVEASQRKGRVRLNLCLSWADPDPGPESDLFADQRLPDSEGAEDG